MQFDIYKIAEKLNEFEKSTGVIRIDPIWGSQMSAQEYYEHMRPRVEAARRLLLPGELGCALAHVNVYRRIFASCKGGLILEDDIGLTNEALKDAESVVKSIKRPDFVQFARYRHTFIKSQLVPGIYVADTSKGFWGTAAYFVSPEMAQRMMRRHSGFVDLADNWQEVFVGCNVIPYYAPIFQHSGEGSRIGDRSIPPQNPSLIQAVRYRLLRRRMEILGPCRRVKQILRAKKTVRIQLDKEIDQ